ncbi:MAG: hypothetical protein WCU88_00370 [Elusimicrobiota bacterium]|jgi:hypothetical protein
MNSFKNKTLWAALLPALMGFSSISHAAPRRINFQGKLLDTMSNPRSGDIGMTFRIFAVPTGGSELWSETRTIRVNNGVFSTELGAQTSLPAGLFMGTSAYLEIEVSPESPMTPRQQFLMVPYAFRALYADIPAAGSTNYLWVSTAQQPGAVFHVSSGTVSGPFMATKTSSFTATGNQTFSLYASSGMRIEAGTLSVWGSGGVDVQSIVTAGTITARSAIILPQGGVPSREGVMRWNPDDNLLFIGTGTSNKTMADTDSRQALTNKSIESTANDLVDATHLRTHMMASDEPSDGMTIKWDAATSQWRPVYPATVTVVTHSFTPNANLTLTANTVYLIPVTVPGVLRLSQIRFRVSTRVLGSSGDVGLYNAAGNLAASGGAGSADTATTGAKVVSMQGAPIDIQPGQYFFAFTCSAGPALRGVDLGAASVGIIKGLGAIVGGGGTTLPASITLAGVTDGSVALFLSAND